MDQSFDIVIVGAGLQGLCAAKTYLACEPSTNLLVLDANESIGGVWAEEKMHTGLRSNNLIGTYEYTDFPMHEGFGVPKGDHIPGTTIHEYLCQYAGKFDLTKRIRVSTQVEAAEMVEGKGWTLRVKSWRTDDKPARYTITCDKLIVATGVTSAPVSMHIYGQENFTAPITYFASLAKDAPKLLASPEVNHVAVYGGSKSAYDAVYLFANAGKRVTWIIRESGHGPTYLGPPYVYLGPFRCWLEKLVTTRFFSFMSPCIWADVADGFGYIRSLLHGTATGRTLVGAFWKKLTSDVIDQTGLGKHEELKKLIPNENAFWYGTGVGILNYPRNIYEFVTSGQVEIVRKDVVGLEGEKKVMLAGGESLETDALVLHAGWKFSPGFQILPESKHAGWGLPSTMYSPEQKDMWNAIHKRADVEILERFPSLATGPRVDQESLLVNPADVLPCAETEPKRKREEYAPLRLWRGIAPPSDVTTTERRLVFLGMILDFNGALRAEIGSLWAYAYLNNKLKGPVKALTTSRGGSSELQLQAIAEADSKRADRAREEIMYDTALFGRFGKWRYPYGMGAKVPDYAFDAVPYFDLLLGDLGLKSWRKGWGWLGEVFGGSYGQEDYKGLVKEWLKKEKMA